MTIRLVEFDAYGSSCDESKRWGMRNGEIFGHFISMLQFLYFGFGKVKTRDKILWPKVLKNN